MRSIFIVLGGLAQTLCAFPGMHGLVRDLMKRQAPPVIPEPLIGDLATKGATTPVGNAVLKCINGTGIDEPCQNLEPKVSGTKQNGTRYDKTDISLTDLHATGTFGESPM